MLDTPDLTFCEKKPVSGRGLSSPMLNQSSHPQMILSPCSGASRSAHERLFALQVIKEIARNPEDKTKVSFVFANQTVDDIILKDELDDIAAKHDNINVRPSSFLKKCMRQRVVWPCTRLPFRKTGNFKTSAFAVAALNIPV